MTINLKGSTSTLHLKDLSVGHSYFDFLRTQTINVKVSETIPVSSVPATRELDVARISVSRDGNTILSTAPQTPYISSLGVSAVNYYDTAYMCILKKVGNNWIPDFIDYFKPYSDYATETQLYGYASSLSGDGLTAVVGDFRDAQSGDIYAGKVYIYTKKQSTWVSETLIPGDLLSNFGVKRFGCSVSLSYDGKTLAIGAFGDGSGNGYFAGAVYVYVKQNGSWTLQQKIQAPSVLGRNTKFGGAVSLADDGNTLAISSPNDSISGTFVGSVRTYTRSGNTWTLDHTFNPSTPTMNQPFFGSSVCLSHDATVLLIGGPANTDITTPPPPVYPPNSSLYTGLACVYRKVSGVWGQAQYLSNVDFGEALRDRGQFGSGLAISYDNTRLIIGGPGCGLIQYGGPTGTTVINVQGESFFYKLSGSTFLPEGTITGLGGGAGRSVEFDVNNNVILSAGRIGYELPYNNLTSGFPWSNFNAPSIVPLFDFTELAFGYDISSSTTGNTIAVGCPYPTANQKIQSGVDPFLGLTEMPPYPVAGSVYVYEKSGDVWSLQQKVQPLDSSLNDMFGMSVALSSDGNTMFVGAPQSSTSSITIGAVYVFTRSGNVWTQIQKIIPSNGVSDGKFGYRTRVSSDGSQLFTSAMRYTSSSNRVGTVYAYKKNTTWDFLQQIVPNTQVTDSLFGGYIEISSDGSTLASGVYNEITAPSLSDFDILVGKGIGVGEVQVFKKTGSLWSKSTTISNSSTNFGRRLDMNSDGSVIAISAERSQGTYQDQGSVCIYTLSGINYTLSSTIVSDLINISSTSGMYFGSSVSMNDTGDVIVIGADQRGSTILPTPFDPSTGDLFGVTYIYKKINGSWIKQSFIKFRYGMFLDRSGWSCKLAKSNSVIAVGSLAIQQNQLYILR